MNRHGHHNIRIGIVWVQECYSTCTCTATLCVIELWTHQKFESLKKNNFRNDEIRIRICYLIPKKEPKSFELVFRCMVTVFRATWTAGASVMPSMETRWKR